MVDKVDMSLDEIIKQSKNLRLAGRKRGRGGAGVRGRRGSAGGGGGGLNRVNRSGAIQKRRSNTGGGLSRFSFNRSLSGDINGRWQHDLFDNSFDGRRSGRLSAVASLGLGSGPAKLLVSNLDYGVSNTDIQELFAEFGPLKSATVHYDKSGRSLGTADVVYDRKADAIKALKQYNGVPLDGRPMNIQLATSEIPLKASILGGGMRARTTRTAVGGRQVRGRGRGGARRGGAGGGRTSTPKPTAEQLDAELDAYVKKVK